MQKVNSEEVPPVHSQDYKIIKEELEDGTVEYRHPVGESVDTFSLEFDLFVGCMEERYKSLIALLAEDDYTEFGILFEALVGYNHRQLDEMLEFLTRCVGRINFHYIARGQTTYRSGRIVGIAVEPLEVLEARMKKAQEAAR